MTGQSHQGPLMLTMAAGMATAVVDRTAASAVTTVLSGGSGGGSDDHDAEPGLEAVMMMTS